MVFRCIYVLQCAGTSSKTQGSNDYLTTWSVRSTHSKACFLAAVYFIQQILRVSHAWHVVLFLLPSYFLAWQVTLAGTHPLIQKMADHNMPIPRLGLAFCTGFGKLHLHRFVFPSTSFAKPGHNVERFPSSLVSGPRNNTLIKLNGSDVFFPQLNSSFVYIYIYIYNSRFFQWLFMTGTWYSFWKNCWYFSRVYCPGRLKGAKIYTRISWPLWPCCALADHKPYCHYCWYYNIAMLIIYLYIASCKQSLWLQPLKNPVYDS